jgi:hypothetical protein
MTLLFGSQSASASGGSSITVTTTATVSGTTVSGTIVISNSANAPASVTAISDWLEVRYPSGYPAPPYPPGTTSDSFRVAEVAIPLPNAIPAKGSRSISYTLNVCGGASSYRGAKDMRNAVVVTVNGTANDARTATFIPPNQASCPVCGNGVVEAGEQCDGGACCTTSCRFIADGTACTDGNACTRTDQCRTGMCTGSNSVVCTASDQCHAPGTCNPTNGTCSNPAMPNGRACQDGNACSTSDACSSGLCVGIPIVCNDGNACTDDVCAGGTCFSVANTAACEDGNVCTDNDTCADGACVSGGPLDCNDHQTCTSDTCGAPTGCVHSETPVCDGCDAPECTACQTICSDERSACESVCWESFYSCLDGCTTTYCAPFCQVDLGTCIETCPDEADCDSTCELGNGCDVGCAP